LSRRHAEFLESLQFCNPRGNLQLPGISATPFTFRIVLQSDSFQFGSRFLSVAFGGTSCSKSDALSCGAAFPTATASCLQGFTREPCTADNRMIRKISTRQDAKFVLNKCWPGTGVAAQQSSPRLFASATSLACCSARSHSATQSRRLTLRGLLWASVVSAEKNL